MKKFIFVVFLLVAGSGVYFSLNYLENVRNMAADFAPSFLTEYFQPRETVAPEPLNISKFDSDAAGYDDPLLAAVRSGKKSEVQLVVNTSTDVNIFDVTGKTPLMQAASGSDNESITKFLLDSGAKINDTDRWNYSSLMYASKYGNPKISELLLNRGADMEIKGIDGETAIMLAAENGDSNVVKKLVSRGVNVNVKDLSGNTPAMIAAKNGNTSALRILIDGGTNINAVNSDGFTALIIASSYGYYNAAKLLLEAKADANIKDIGGSNASDHATKFGHDDITALIRQYIVE